MIVGQADQRRSTTKIHQSRNQRRDRRLLLGQPGGIGADQRLTRCQAGVHLADPRFGGGNASGGGEAISGEPRGFAPRLSGGGRQALCLGFGLNGFGANPRDRGFKRGLGDARRGREQRRQHQGPGQCALHPAHPSR